MNRIRSVLIITVAFAGCGVAGREVCELDGDPVALDPALRESSGLAASRTHRNVLWTHNDSDGGENLFAIDERGRLLGTVVLEGAHNRDWEDIAIAACPPGGPDGDCIYIADIGDNRATRDDIGVWILPEPEPRDQTVSGQVFLPMRYPDGARDAEAVAVLNDHRMIVVSKGREHPITVFRSPALRWPDTAARVTLTLEVLQSITTAAADLPDQVTGASIDRNGRRIAIRSYARLQFYAIEGDRLQPLLEMPVALDPLAEPQGEGVAIGRRGAVFLSSEAGPQAIAPRLTRLRCRIP